MNPLRPEVPWWQQRQAGLTTEQIQRAKVVIGLGLIIEGLTNMAVHQVMAKRRLRKHP